MRELPLPHRAFWRDLEHHILDIGAQPSHYLLCTQRTIPRVGIRRYPYKPMSGHAAHDWWYRCLATAGIVAPGTTSGEKMHKSRHTAGQRVLDATGNLKAVQKLLGHASIQTTGDIYADWDIDQLAATMADVLDDDETADSQSFPPVPAAKTNNLQRKRGFSGDGGNRTHVRDRVRMASTSVAGTLISPLASLAGRVARGQPHEMFPDRLRRTSPGEPAF